MPQKDPKMVLIRDPSWLLKVERGTKRLGPHPDDICMPSASPTAINVLLIQLAVITAMHECILPPITAHSIAKELSVSQMLCQLCKFRYCEVCCSVKRVES